MLRLMGAVLVAGGGALAGLLAVMRLQERVRTLSSFLGALELMESEIRFRLTPVPELLEFLIPRTGEPACSFFRVCRKEWEKREEESFSRIWQKGLEILLPAVPEREVLGQLGEILGRYDVEGQRQAIAYVRRRLELLLRQAEEERRSRGRAYLASGVAAGLCSAVILL